jgi:CRISPR system Cascade subunit CasB
MRRVREVCDRFTAYLRRLQADDHRAALAKLRRGLGKEPGTVMEMHGLVQPWLPPGLEHRQEDACYLIASLFASHPEPGGRGSLGSAFARLKKDSDSVEKRFVALLNSDEDDLPSHLRHAVSLLASGRVPVEWARLLYDVQYWGHPDRFVQRQWSRDFCAGAPSPGDDEVGNTAPSANERS